MGARLAEDCGSRGLAANKFCTMALAKRPEKPWGWWHNMLRGDQKAKTRAPTVLMGVTRAQGGNLAVVNAV
jgi:hypothetical protein